MEGRTAREILAELTLPLGTYADVDCPECGEFLCWDEIIQHVQEKHGVQVPGNIILGYN